MRKLLDRGAGTVDDQDEVQCMFVRILHGLHNAGIVPYTMKCVCALVTGVESDVSNFVCMGYTLRTHACE